MILFQKIDHQKRGSTHFYEVNLNNKYYLVEKRKGYIRVSSLGLPPDGRSYFGVGDKKVSPYRVISEAVRRGFCDVRGTISLSRELVEAA